MFLADAAKAGQPVLFIARDDVHLDQAAEALAFMAPDLNVLTFPAWDCLPYDRVSPKTDIIARRVGTLTDLRPFEGPKAMPDWWRMNFFARFRIFFFLVVVLVAGDGRRRVCVSTHTIRGVRASVVPVPQC